MMSLRGPSAKHYWDGLERLDNRLQELSIGLIVNQSKIASAKSFFAKYCRRATNKCYVAIVEYNGLAVGCAVKWEGIMLQKRF